MFRSVSIASFFVIAATAAQADCLTAATGAGCRMALSSTSGVKTVEAVSTSPRYDVGDHLPRGQYYMLMNRSYYGLPPIDGYWRYYEVDNRVLKVHPDTLEVLGDATGLTNAAF